MNSLRRPIENTKIYFTSNLFACEFFLKNKCSPWKMNLKCPAASLSALSRISSFKAMENKGSSVQQSMRSRSMRIAHGGSPSLLWPLVATYIIFRMLLLQSSCSRGCVSRRYFFCFLVKKSRQRCPVAHTLGRRLNMKKRRRKRKGKKV